MNNIMYDFYVFFVVLGCKINIAIKSVWLCLIRHYIYEIQITILE